MQFNAPTQYLLCDGKIIAIYCFQFLHNIIIWAGGGSMQQVCQIAACSEHFSSVGRLFELREDMNVQYLHVWSPAVFMQLILKHV